MGLANAHPMGHIVVDFDAGNGSTKAQHAPTRTRGVLAAPSGRYTICTRGLVGGGGGAGRAVCAGGRVGGRGQGSGCYAPSVSRLGRRTPPPQTQDRTPSSPAQAHDRRDGRGPRHSQPRRHRGTGSASAASDPGSMSRGGGRPIPRQGTGSITLRDWGTAVGRLVWPGPLTYPPALPHQQGAAADQAFCLFSVEWTIRLQMCKREADVAGVAHCPNPMTAWLYGRDPSLTPDFKTPFFMRFSPTPIPPKSIPSRYRYIFVCRATHLRWHNHAKSPPKIHLHLPSCLEHQRHAAAHG